MVTLCVVCPGCMSGSLASNTGPRAPGEKWSTDRDQSAHVGESVQFDFVLKDWKGALAPPTVLADYCVFTIGTDHIAVEASPLGHFSCGFRFDSFHPDNVVNIEAVAYRQRGARDWVKARGQWIQSSTPGDEADISVARDALRMRIYQAEFVLKVSRAADDPDPSTGLLRFSTDTDRTATFALDRNGSRGFRLDGPDPDGSYVVRFEPPAEALAPTGRTSVVFTIKDRAGQTHVFDSTMDTP